MKNQVGSVLMCFLIADLYCMRIAVLVLPLASHVPSASLSAEVVLESLCFHVRLLLWDSFVGSRRKAFLGQFQLS